MTVFKAFWKVIKKYKGTIILYTVMLVLFGGLNMTSNNISTTFVDSKPDILIVNNDEETNRYLRVAFIPNYNVSSAEIIFPATDISE